MAHFLRVALAVSVTVLALLRIWPTTQWHCHFESEPIPHSDLRSADDPRLEAYGDPATAISCKSLSDQDSISLSLPSDAALLFFLSRGPISGQFRLSKDATALSNSVELTVSTEDASLEAQICRMGSDTANEHGLLLWANPEEPRPTIKVLITVQLPTYEFFYQDFSAHLPFFAYDIDDLWTQYAAFEILRLKTVDAEITYEGLLASSIFLQTSNANVSGFSDGYELDVCTSNAAIEAISRFQAEEPGQVLRLNLKTSIGPIYSSPAVFSPFKNLVLLADIHTSLGPILIQPRLPLPSLNTTLHLDVSTSLKPISFWLDANYEGQYDLGTTASAVRVEPDPEVQDPLGRGRKRVITGSTEDSMHVQGNIHWGQEWDWSRGSSIKARTSLAQIRLHV